MKEVTKDVKTGKVVDGVKKQVKVAEVTCPIYETMEELTANVKAEEILRVFNKQNVIEVQGKERAKHQEGRAGKTKRRSIAYDNCLTTEELQQFEGDFDGLKAFLDSEVMSARVDEYLASQEG